MSEADSSWSALRAAWREASPPGADLDPEALRRRVRRQSLGLVALAGTEVVLALVFVGTLVALTVADPDPVLVIATAATSLFFAAAFLFAWRNRRGLWRAGAETTRSFARLTRRRCRARLRSIRFAWWLLGAEVAFFLVWLPWELTTDPDPAGGGPGPWIEGFGLLALLVLVFGLFLARYRRRTLDELAAVNELLERLDREPAA